MRAGVLARGLALIVGVALLLLLIAGTFGLVLIAIAGIGIAALVRRFQGVPLTRRSSWAGAVATLALACVLLGSWAGRHVPGQLFRQIREQQLEQRDGPAQARARRWQRFLTGGAAPDSTFEAGNRALAQSKPFLWWVTFTTLAFLAVFVGGSVGSAGWGVAMLIAFGVRGRWPLAPGRPPPLPAGGGP